MTPPDKYSAAVIEEQVSFLEAQLAKARNPKDLKLLPNVEKFQKNDFKIQWSAH